MAIDSSHIALPPDAALREYYGAAGHELSTATARASLLYDIENDIIAEARIEPLAVDERSLADNIRQDFYAMMTVSNMLSSALREANEKIQREAGKNIRIPGQCEPRGGVLKDRLIGILIAEDRFVRNQLYRELVREIRRRVVPVRPNREVPRKDYYKKPHFHHNHKSNC
jgi:hypothetical protein